MMSLWGKDFELVDTKAKTKSIVNKTKSPKNVKVEKAPKNTGASLFDRLNSIKVDVLRILGIYKENTITLKSIIKFRSYIDAAIKNGVVAIDTETNNSLDPLTCKIMGLCLYTPGQKNAYIPVNHTTMEGERYNWQVTEDQIKIELERIKAAKVKTIWHNAKFDYEVLKCTCNCEMYITWDTIIGARILNENELSGLKYQYIRYVDPSIEKYDIESLFADIDYAIISPELFALYAATDSFMTYKLYEYQQEQFKLKENAGLQNIFNIEMQVIIPTAEMELTGVCIDSEFAKRLSDKWHKKREIVVEKLNNELDKLSPVIDEWRKTPEANFQPTDPKTGKIKKSKNEQLKTPINLLSPTQLAILLYDVLKVPVIDKQNPRGTGEEIIAQIKHPLCSLILEQRGIEKLLGTYIDKIPQCLSPKDNRLHTSFKQLGADTGRYSSENPNIQNIPSHEKSIRMMFAATPGYVMVGSDYSQQEPRLLATYSNDESMLSAYMNNKDLYATIATGIYHNDYWDNMEFHEKEKIHPNPEGKKRRSNCKSILLGLMYGRGANSIAEQINSTKEEAQSIIDGFYKSFPKVKQWMDKSKETCKANGYVSDLWGRRRRLPDMQLSKFEVKYKDENKQITFNPLLINSPNIIQIGNNDATLKDIENKLYAAKGYKQIKEIKEFADKQGIKVKDNGGFISEAERQCVNARIQGGAATLTKLAMIATHYDKTLNELGFRMLIPVHDEIIGECPIENAEAVAKRLPELMIEVAKKDVKCPMKCDATIEPCWYYTDYGDALREEYQDMLDNGISKEKAMELLNENHCECLPDQIKAFISS